MAFFLLRASFFGAAFWGMVTITYAQIPLNSFDTTSIAQLPDPPIDVLRVGNVTTDAPDAVTASDGTYDDFVKVVWTETTPGDFYRVERASRPDFSDAEPISNGWKRSNWMLDTYRLVPGRVYYYRVAAGRDSRTVSDFSAADRGYVRGQPIALPIPAEERPATVGIVVEFKYFDREEFRRGEELVLPFILGNMTGQNLTDRALYFVLTGLNMSEDDTPRLENRVVLPEVPAQTYFRDVVRMQLPPDLPTGNYRLSIEARDFPGALLDSRLLTVMPDE